MKRKLRGCARSFALTSGLCAMLLAGKEWRGASAEHAGAYVHQRVLDARGRETRDLYPGVTYTNEVWMAVVGQTWKELGQGIGGVRFVMHASPHVHVKQRVQEQPVYGTKDLLWGRSAGTNIVRFEETSTRSLASNEAKGVGKGEYVLARYSFTAGSTQTFAVTSFWLEDVRVWNPQGGDVQCKERTLKTVSVNPLYRKPVVISEFVPGNDLKYSPEGGVEVYFSTRDQKVVLERSFDLVAWHGMYTNLVTCPSFTFQIPSLWGEEKQFFRVRLREGR